MTGQPLCNARMDWEHCCTPSLCYLGGDHHKNPNINTEIIQLGNHCNAGMDREWEYVVDGFVFGRQEVNIRMMGTKTKTRMYGDIEVDGLVFGR